MRMGVVWWTQICVYDNQKINQGNKNMGPAVMETEKMHQKDYFH